MRPRIAVACGVLIDARGEVLIAQRPAGKIAAGRWEFPGGKIEPGEAPREALRRELHEELGIDITQARPLIRITHDYSDRTVILDTWLVDGWDGELQGREGQAWAWCQPSNLWDFDLLEADGPIVNALRLPSHYVFTPPDVGVQQLLPRLGNLPASALLRLRLPRLDAVAYEAAARAVIAEAPKGISVILDRDPAMVERLGAAGWHGSVSQLAGLGGRPVTTQHWFCGSAHDAAELQRLRELGADCAVLGPVQATASHPGQPVLGWDRFSALVADANLPVYALGGVGAAQLVQAQACHAQGTAGISAYWDFGRP